MRRMLNRSRFWLVSLAAGGSGLVLSGCDVNVRDTVLAGVEGAAGTLLQTFITAFFQTLEEPEETGVGTVKAILEMMPDFFA